MSVDDIAARASISHGTFYLYFASKEDLFTTLLHDALQEMAALADDFPVVTPNDAGPAALRSWVTRFGEVYAAHSTVIGILSQADAVSAEAWGDGLRLLFRLAEMISQGMTAVAAPRNAAATPRSPRPGKITALACLLMLERVNYLLSLGGLPPAEDLAGQLSAIIYAAFST